MNNILLKFRTKLITRSLWPDELEWGLIKDTIRSITDEHHIDPVTFSDIITKDNVRLTKTLLLNTYKLIYQKARLEHRRLEQSQI